MSHAYLIDDQPVNAREDWRHQIIPGNLSARSAESFPGDAKRYIVKGDVLPDSVVITGFLEAATLIDLRAEVATYTAMQGATTLKSISINDVPFTGMDLRRFEVAGKIQGCIRYTIAPDENPQGVRQAVRFIWEGTS